MSKDKINLEDPITSIGGIGDSYAIKLEKLNVSTVLDIIHLLPNRYLDFTKQLKVKELKEKEASSFLATITNVKSFYTKSGKLLTQATAQDSTGKISLGWFNNPYIKKIIRDGQEYTIAGQPTLFAGKLTLFSPTIEEGNSFSLNTKGLVPVYPLTKGLTSRWLRQKIYSAIEELKIEEPLSESLINSQSLLNLKSSYFQIHFPQNKREKLIADKRLSFNQHLLINLTNQLKISSLGNSPQIKFDESVHLEGLKKFPFTLTEDQIKATNFIFKDLKKSEFTHRLIQGDTGSGKTATIILAANQSLAQNKSCVFIAPTQILANQHAETFQKYLLKPERIQLVLGGNESTVKTDKPYIYIGTHALITKLPQLLDYPVVFLAIDEQHKFGVKQREELQNRTPVPHLFNLSATPIPRTVALGLLGDISLSNIKFKPQNRLPIKTFVVSTSYFSKSTSWLIKNLNENNKIYIVCPNIYASDTETSSVEKITVHYKKLLPPHTPIFSLHGQMKSQEQQEIIKAFKLAGGSVLISTSLIEVGIDIPSATIMIIHSAERFGLAQLHQLRGRVGRGETQSYCFLVPSNDDQVEKDRLQLLQKYNNGLTLAKKDLMLRGSGEVFGEKQHGTLQTKLKYFWSKKSFLKTKAFAKQLINSDPRLAEQIAFRLKAC